MNNEKEILTKLLAIAKNQQKAIHKLAQAQGLATDPGQPVDPNLDYLKRAVGPAATNAGVRTPLGVDVKANAGSAMGNVKIESTYTVSVRGLDQADEKTKQNFLHTYQTQVKTQKPELDGRVSVLFS